MDLIKIADDKHKELLRSIHADFNVIEKATENFNKTQSQFMDSMLTLHQLTPIRSARQCLAEIKKSRLAMEEAYFKIKKTEISIRKWELLKEENSDPLNIEYFDIEIQEAQNQIKNINENVQGAIRRIAHFIAQYKNILKAIGKESFTEADFEADEERYHIKTAFSQSLNAARARGGIIDEGNMIYLFQIGISGTAAQVEVQRFFNHEDLYIQRGEMPPFKDTLDWLDEMADKYAGSALKFSEAKGIELINKQSLITE
jgi:hypothetical protein